MTFWHWTGKPPGSNLLFGILCTAALGLDAPDLVYCALKTCFFGPGQRQMAMPWRFVKKLQIPRTKLQINHKFQTGSK